LIGGSGDAAPYLGMGADLIESIDMVLYDGSEITVRRDDTDPMHKDIFFASAGGTGGLGIVTSFTERILKNPGENEFTFVGGFAKGGSNPPVNNKDWFYTFQNFLFNDNFILNDDTEKNSESYLFGGGGGLGFYFGLFLGSEKKLEQVFDKAGLTNPDIVTMLPDFWIPWVIQNMQPWQENGVPEDQRNETIYCGNKNACKPYASLPFTNQADAQIFQVCAFQNVIITLFGPNYGRGLDVCQDLGLSSEYCCGWNGFNASWAEGCQSVDVQLRPFTRLNPAKCADREVLDAYLNAAQIPQSFLNKAPLAKEIVDLIDGVLGPLLQMPEFSVFGSTVDPHGQGTGGLMIPKLQNSTIESIIEFGNSLPPPPSPNDDFAFNHFQHGASMMLDHDTNGYPHRNTALMTNSFTRSPQLVDRLLKDPAYDNKVANLQIYGNYNPSVFLPQIESLVYGYNHSAELSRIRTKYDPHGIFDSPRYVQRNRRELYRTVPQYPNKPTPEPTPSPTPMPTPKTTKGSKKNYNVFQKLSF
jgi:hypothetical protein